MIEIITICDICGSELSVEDDRIAVAVGKNWKRGEDESDFHEVAVDLCKSCWNKRKKEFEDLFEII